MYVGTACSFVIRYALEEDAASDGRACVASSKAAQKCLGTRGPVQTMRAMSALNRLLCLSNGNFLSLGMVDLDVVVAQSKLSGVSAFCVNENPTKNDPFCVQVCVARRKHLQLYDVTEEKVTHRKDVPVPETPLAMAMDGDYVCVALSTRYAVIDCATGAGQELFPYESSLTVPLVKRIAKEEFLLNGPSALGMFATTAGVSERPPLPWTTSVKALAYCRPYVVCLCDDRLTVYSVLDQQPKQKLSFRGGTYLDNFEGRIFVSGKDTVFLLRPVPWEAQVHALLSDGRVSEALELARHSGSTGLLTERHVEALRKIYRRAGFLEFSECHLPEARELFLLGDVDVTELVSLYPGLLPATRPSVPPSDVPDVVRLASGDPVLLEKYCGFLASYLEGCRVTDRWLKTVIATALLKLYAEWDRAKLDSFLETGACARCDLAECVARLTEKGLHHAAARLYAAHGEYERALHLWSRMLAGSLVDSSFPGLSFYVEFLARLHDRRLVWKYAEFALERDQVAGVKVFTERSREDPDPTCPDGVLEFLHRFPDAVVKYLEHLVYEEKNEKEKYHTLLAVLYLDTVLRFARQSGADEELKMARGRLQHLLSVSSSYRVQLLLGKALENDLHQECAILYGKLEEHDKALRILVHQLKDYVAAEDYCRRLSRGRDGKYRHRLYHGLLAVYLDRGEREDAPGPAVRLLNSRAADFDAVKVLQMIPQTWSVATVDRFLGRAVRSSLHRSSTSRVACALAKGEVHGVQGSKLFLERGALTLTEDRACGICHESFADPSFVRWPDGSFLHSRCSGVAGSPDAGR